MRIIEHADVKRMLLAQKSYCEGALALELYCARLVDEQHTGRPQAADEARLLLEVLTPIAKSWPSEWCLEANSLAIQIHGGYGYTRDFPVEQYWRDNRLNMIHEGTHGIQAADLLGRKVLMEGGRGLQLLAGRVNGTIERAIQRPELAEYANALGKALQQVGAATKAAWATGDPARPWPMPCRTCRPSATWCWPGSGWMWRWRCRAGSARAGRTWDGCAPRATSSTTNCPRSAPGSGRRQPRPDLRRTCPRRRSDGLRKTLARIERLIWILIYGGLFALILGIAILQAAPPAPGR